VFYPTDGSKSGNNVLEYTAFTSQETVPAVETSNLAYREGVSELK
jgi:hypothetical protein